MKPCDLLGKEHVVGTLDLTVFKDLQLENLLLLFFSEEQTKNIINVLLNPLSSTGIKQRQELFIELRDQQIEEYFISLRKNLSDLQAIFKTYSLHKNPQYKHIYYVNVMLKYIEFISHVCNHSLWEKVNSSLLKGFIESFLQIQNSDDYCQLVNEANRLKAELRIIKSVELDITTPNGSPSKVSLSEEKSISIADELLTIAKNLEEIQDEIRRPLINRELSSNFIAGLANLYPKLFTQLESFHNQYQDIFRVSLFDYIDHISFFLHMNQLFSVLKQHNIPLAIPEIATNKKISIDEAYDVSLLIKMKSGIVPNNVDFNEEQGFFLLTGANSGGKTSYLRAVGICQVLFLAGGYIPATKAEIYPFQEVMTHFPVDEGKTDTGRLQEEQIRVTEILANINENSLVFLNETFSSTNQQLSIELSYDLLEKLCQVGACGIFVTHQHQLIEKAKQIEGKTQVGYLTVVVQADEQNTRTYKIVEHKFDTKSFAHSILDKYGLSREKLLKRLLEVDEC